MGTRLFIGNLSYAVTEQELREAFTGDGIELRSVRVALDRETGRPRGFAFVETMTDEGAKASIEKLSGRVLQGRSIIVEEAQAEPAGPRPGGFGGPPRPGGFGGPRPGVARPWAQADRRVAQAAPAVLVVLLGLAASVGRHRSGRRPRRLRTAGGPGGRPGRRRHARPAAGPDAPPRSERDRPEKKRSTRPKPEERERGNWRWDRNPDDE